MRSNHYLTVLGCAALLTSFALTAGAQTHTPMPGMGRPHMSGKMHMPPTAGQIIGNKKTKVYHLPGGKGNMPEGKNRVFFRTEREAIAAGYHIAGSMMGSKPGVLPMHGHTMNRHLPK